MSRRQILALIGLGARTPQPAADDHVAGVERPARPSAGDLITLAASKPPEASPRRRPEPAAVAPLTPPTGQTGKLAALTVALGRQKAGQALWAPGRLTPAERRTAERILKELDQ